MPGDLFSVVVDDLAEEGSVVGCPSGFERSLELIPEDPVISPLGAVAVFLEPPTFMIDALFDDVFEGVSAGSGSRLTPVGDAFSQLVKPRLFFNRTHADHRLSQL